MGRTKKAETTVTRSGPEGFESFAELETRLASVAVENIEKKISAREKLLQTRVLMYQAHYKGPIRYSKTQIAAAFKTNLHTVSNYIAAVEAGIKMAAMIRGSEVTRS